MNCFAVIVALALVVAYVSAEELANEVKTEDKKSPSGGHQFQLRPNTESRRVGLKKLQELMQRNLGLKPKQLQNDDQNREKRSFGHRQPIHHAQPDYQEYCEPDYVVEYVEYYEPQDYC